MLLGKLQGRENAFTVMCSKTTMYEVDPQFIPMLFKGQLYLYCKNCWGCTSSWFQTWIAVKYLLK